MKPKDKNGDVDSDKLLYKDLSYKIVQASYEVHNVLGPGYPEKIYEEAMNKELASENVSVNRQRIIAVIYTGQKIGEYRLDMVAEGRFCWSSRRFPK